MILFYSSQQVAITRMNNMVKKSKLRKIFNIALIFSVGILISGCSATRIVSSNMIPLYDGDLRPPYEVAIIRWDSTICLKEIKRDSIVLPPRWRSQPGFEIHLLPGSYRITYGYENNIYKIPKKSAAIDFDALPGHVYQITAKVEKINFRGGRVTIMTWYPEVKDTTSR